MVAFTFYWTSNDFQSTQLAKRVIKVTRSVFKVELKIIINQREEHYLMYDYNVRHKKAASSLFHAGE